MRPCSALYITSALSALCPRLDCQCLLLSLHSVDKQIPSASCLSLYIDLFWKVYRSSSLYSSHLFSTESFLHLAQLLLLLSLAFFARLFICSCSLLPPYPSTLPLLSGCAYLFYSATSSPLSKCSPPDSTALQRDSLLKSCAPPSAAHLHLQPRAAAGSPILPQPAPPSAQSTA